MLSFWGRCMGVLDDAGVCEWLQGRGLHPATIEDLDLARVVPSGEFPGWARLRGRSWRESGHRLVVPLHDARGDLRSFQARQVEPEGGGPKSVSPCGVEVRGLVFADALGRRVLRRGDRHPPFDLVLAEGVPDYLSWASRWGCDAGLEDSPAVLSVVAGSWTQDVAERIPSGSRLALRMHGDDAGDCYAATVARTLDGRVSLARVRRAA